jgi:hypothetical protein
MIRPVVKIVNSPEQSKQNHQIPSFRQTAAHRFSFSSAILMGMVLGRLKSALGAREETP